MLESASREGGGVCLVRGWGVSGPGWGLPGPGGGGSAWSRGVSGPGGGGGLASQHALRHTPPCGQNHRRL